MTYLEAKLAMLSRWTSSGEELPRCALCGNPTWNPHAHHWLMSRRFEKLALWSMVPVCNAAAGNCHQLAEYGEGKALVAQAALNRLGNGCRVCGYNLLVAEVDKCGFKSKTAIPTVDFGIALPYPENLFEED